MNLGGGRSRGEGGGGGGFEVEYNIRLQGWNVFNTTLLLGIML